MKAFFGYGASEIETVQAFNKGCYFLQRPSMLGFSFVREKFMLMNSWKTFHAFTTVY